jgi:type I restriction enzyme M protein
MKKDTPLGSRIAEVHNGSSLFTGDAGSGESNARRYLIENDLVEAIIALPENMFYNTGIGTFIWILSNKKEERRKGKIQLIDASKMKSPLRKNMGKKNCEFTADIRADILRIFLEMEESEVSRIFNNDEFGYWSITVDRPLRQKVTVNVETIKQTLAMFKTLYGIDVEHEEDVFVTVAPSDILSFTQNYPNVRVVKMPKTFGQEQTEQIYRMYMKALIDFVQEEPYMDYNAFIEKFYKNPHIKNNPFKFKKFEDFMYPLLEKDEKAEVVYDKGKPVVDTELRDTEIVPFTYEGGIDAFMKNEVLTYAPDAFVDENKTTVGYEISFTKYFYKPVELREMSEILADLNALEQQADGMMASIMEGIL